MRRILLLIMITSLLFGFGNSQTPISSCTTITSPGTYVLTNDINTTSSICFSINSNDVILDCNGHSIKSITPGGVSAIVSNGGVSYYRNITVKNCFIEDWTNIASIGIDFRSVINAKIINVAFFNNIRHILFYDVYDSLISNSSFENNIYETVTFQYGGNNLVKDSVFRCGCGNAGILNYLSDNNTIINSIFENNGYGVSINGGNNITIRSSTFRINFYQHIGGSGNLITISDSYFDGEPSIAVYIGTANNLTIKNSYFQGLGDKTAITFGNAVQYSEISNVTIRNFNVGISMWSGSGSILNNYNAIRNSKIINNNYGITIPSGLFFGCPSSNMFYNNLFNNTIENVLVSGEVFCPNYFNTTKQPGPNIVGGPFVGGNYWGKPDRTGFSDTCTDSNGDGFCDEPFNVYSPFGYIDYLPLSLIPEMKVTTRVFYVNKDFKEVSLCVGDKSKPMTIFACSISNWIYENLVTTTVVFIFAFLIIYFFRRLI